jgi:hypothetical protein
MAKFEKYVREKCPHCLTTVRLEPIHEQRINDTINGVKENLDFTIVFCPNCGKFIITIETLDKIQGVGFRTADEFVVWPLSFSRNPLPPDTPEHIGQDYLEASRILNLSPKASAALSRRCLQALLREKGNATQKDLIDQIKFISPSLPTHISSGLDAIRNIGNFGAHPIKSQSSGEIVEVEPGEAEWNLDILDLLIDFYFVQPAITANKKEALNKKLIDAGKKPID